VHLNRPVKGQRLDNLEVFSMPRRFCNCYGFFLVFEILNFRQINSTTHVTIAFKFDSVREFMQFKKSQCKKFFPNKVDYRFFFIAHRSPRLSSTFGRFHHFDICKQRKCFQFDFQMNAYCIA